MYSLIDSYGLFLSHSLLIPAILWRNTKQRWSMAEILVGSQLVLAMLYACLFVFSGSTITTGSSQVFRATGLSLTMLVLISFIGFIVLRYARANLAGDPDSNRFLSWYLLTLVAVGVTVTANHLVIFALAWVAISLCLNKLLLFYSERPRANLAAHKKFIFARLSELLLFTAFALLFFQHGSSNISSLLAHYRTVSEASIIDQIIACLLAIVALIKCAQLPLHGWLIQVVEAPTPVSALLHAGIINLGGFLLLLFAPLLSLVPFAQWLILIVAGLSCVIAALIMMTRISIKVRLAWSTVAQMGLMLVECALGLYELALLHLIAHSCYKAHAFLGAGEAVNNYLRKMYTQAGPPTLKDWSKASLCLILPAAAAIYVAGAPNLFSPWVLISIAMLNLLAFHFSAGKQGNLISTLATSAGAVISYLVLSFFTGQIIGETGNPVSMWADAWISLVFVSLFCAYLFITYTSGNSKTRQWFIRLNAAFYLDEWSTRVTLWLWPISLTTTQPKHLATVAIPVASNKLSIQ